MKKNFTLIKSVNLSVKYIENFFNLDESQLYMRQLTQSVLWRREKIKMWGKEIVTKRRIAWYADDGKSYTYSGSTFFPSRWNDVLFQLKEKVENYSEIKFNSVLLNEYPNGEVGMGWHSDDEK